MKDYQGTQFGDIELDFLCNQFGVYYNENKQLNSIMNIALNMCY